MSPRLRQWALAGVALLVSLALMIGWTGYLNARNNPRLMQTPPGGQARPYPEGSMLMRVSSMVITEQVVTNRGANPAPAGMLWVVAIIDFVPEADFPGCSLDLLATDGRRWTEIEYGALEGTRATPGFCSNNLEPGQQPRAELVYRIPETAAGSLAGLVSERTGYRGTEPFWVLTPPA